jgi:CSLREA domain-containing protein
MPRIPLATVAVLALAAAPAGAIVVDSTADSVAVDGACTLREAIDNVNAGVDTTGGDCATGSTITFDPSTDGVPIVLTGADGDDLNLSGGLDHHRAARDQGWCNQR